MIHGQSVDINQTFRSTCLTLPQNPDFQRPWKRSLLKTLWEEGAFSPFPHNVFYSSQDKFQYYFSYYAAPTTYPQYPRIAFTSILHNILSKTLAVFPNYHRQQESQVREE